MNFLQYDERQSFDTVSKFKYMGRKANEITSSERKIINLFNQNKSFNETANIVHRSQSTVQSIINKFKDRKKYRISRDVVVHGNYVEERKIAYIIKTTTSEISTEIKEYSKKYIPVLSKVK